MKCDVIAEGVIAAVKEVGLEVPLVVRLEGTNVELGKAIVAESGLNVIAADDLDDAAQKIVAAGEEGVTPMSILIGKETKIICQGFTGKNGTFHSRARYCLRHENGRRRRARQRRDARISACRSSIP